VAIQLICVACERVASGGAAPRCATCGGRLEVVRGALPLPYDADPSAAGIFRYAALLPAVPIAARVSLAEGRTPLLDIPAAGATAGVPRLLAKDESRNPTGTFKDRVMALAASVARAERAPGIVCASTGNAGASAAAYGARAGLPVVILVPVGTPPAKMAQAAVCGARVVAVQGTYSDAWALAAAASASLGWINTTTTFTCPYVVEATRTVAYEIEEQLGVPAGSPSRSVPARCWSASTAASPTWWRWAGSSVRRASSPCNRRAAHPSSGRSTRARPRGRGRGRGRWPAASPTRSPATRRRAT
jgi:threonine synthase